MLNIIWLGLILIAVICGIITGNSTAVVNAATEYAKLAITIAIGLTGIMAFWLGLMKIAEEAGLVKIFARLIRPITRRLFPDIPVEHPAMGAMAMNITANMLGLGNAATPFGLRAMEELEKLNKTPGTASNAMCTFLAINTSNVQLIPATAIAFLVAAGSTHPTAIIATGLFATSCSTIAGIFAAKTLEKLPVFRIKPDSHQYEGKEMSPESTNTMKEAEQ